MIEVKRDLIIPDQHFPLNDPIYWRVILAIARNLPFNNIVTIGDFLDCGAVSSHPRPVANRYTMREEFKAGNQGLDELTEAGHQGNPYCRFHKIAGNHEFRLGNYLANQASAIEDIGPTIEGNLRLKDRGWSYTPYRGYLQLGNAYLTHDVGRKAGPTAHRQAVVNLHVNIIHGHTHRLGVQYEGSLDGHPRYGAMLGWGGSVEAMSGYQDELSIRANSVHGFGILYRWKTPEGHSRSTIVAVPVFEGGAVVEGSYFG